MIRLFGCLLGMWCVGSAFATNAQIGNEAFSSPLRESKWLDPNCGVRQLSVPPAGTTVEIVAKIAQRGRYVLCSPVSYAMKKMKFTWAEKTMIEERGASLFVFFREGSRVEVSSNGGWSTHELERGTIDLTTDVSSDLTFVPSDGSLVPLRLEANGQRWSCLDYSAVYPVKISSEGQVIACAVGAGMRIVVGGESVRLSGGMQVFDSQGRFRQGFVEGPITAVIANTKRKVEVKGADAYDANPVAFDENGKLTVGTLVTPIPVEVLDQKEYVHDVDHPDLDGNVKLGVVRGFPGEVDGRWILATHWSQLNPICRKHGFERSLNRVLFQEFYLNGRSDFYDAVTGQIVTRENETVSVVPVEHYCEGDFLVSLR